MQWNRQPAPADMVSYVRVAGDGNRDAARDGENDQDDRREQWSERRTSETPQEVEERTIETPKVAEKMIDDKDDASGEGNDSDAARGGEKND